MSILIDENTRLLVQGITGNVGLFHTKQMKQFGTNIVAGVTPGKGGKKIQEIPVFDTVEEAMDEKPNASIIFVPARAAADAIFEAVDNGIELIVCITEGIPVHDMMRLHAYLETTSSLLIGPNSPGMTSPDKSKVGIMPNPIHKQGNIGVVSRSGTLTYEIIHFLSKHEFGQSTSIGIGGDPIVGMSFVDILKLFEEDPDTKAVVLVGEIGGGAEEASIDFIKQMSKPVISYIVGVSAPPGKTMGHAGAIISMGKGSAKEKISAFENAGIPVAKSPVDIIKWIKFII